jgi:hypothetical protein
MKSLLRLSFLLVLTVTALVAQQAPPIEFNGVVVTAKKIRVSLFDPATGNARWVAVGGHFAGYIVSAYNPAAIGSVKSAAQADSVVLMRESDRRLLPAIRLKSAVFSDSPPADWAAGPSYFEPPPGAE